MAGKLYGVGVGPGEPELMTLKAVRIIEHCDIIAVPGTEKESTLSYRIAKNVIDGLDKKECLCLSMPMTRDRDELDKAHRLATDKVIDKLKDNKDVAFLTLGDPTIYSTFIYIMRLVKDAGFETEIVSGVTSFCAGSALIHDSLADEEESIHIIPRLDDVDEILGLNGTKVIMKASKNYRKLLDGLKQRGLEAKMICNAGLDCEVVYESVSCFPDEIDYFSIIIIK